MRPIKQHSLRASGEHVGGSRKSVPAIWSPSASRSARARRSWQERQEKKEKKDKIVKKEKKGKKKKVFLFSILALLVLVLSGLGYYFSTTTGPQVTVDKLVTAIEQKDYREVASILSSDKDKWTKEEAQGLLDYMTAQKIDVITN